jgi:hypothetical protein
MSQPAGANSYLAAVITLYLDLPETPMRPSLADRRWRAVLIGTVCR